MDPSGHRPLGQPQGVALHKDGQQSAGRQVPVTTPQRKKKYVVTGPPKRSWFAATWRWYWHWPNLVITKAVLTLLSLFVSVDQAAETAEVASDITGIGIIDNVLLLVEVPVEVLLLLVIVGELVRHREKIRYYRYCD